MISDNVLPLCWRLGAFHVGFCQRVKTSLLHVYWLLNCILPAYLYVVFAGRGANVFDISLKEKNKQIECCADCVLFVTQLVCWCRSGSFASRASVENLFRDLDCILPGKVLKQYKCAEGFASGANTQTMWKV